MMPNHGEQLPRTKYLKHTIQLTLDEMYTGTVRKLAINKNRVCDVCLGLGSISAFPQEYDTCEQCNGLGQKIIIIRSTPDIQEQIRRNCYMCWGKGEAIIPEDRCRTCHGQKVVAEQSILIVRVKRGTRHGQKIIYKGEGTQEPNMRPGDIVVIFEALKHPIYKREGDDLVMKMRLDLVESLCGFDKLVKTLDKRHLSVSNPHGNVIQNHDVKYLVGEGMPKFRNPGEKGRLIIEFEVILPDRIRMRHVNSLEQCLPARQQDDIPIDAVECNLVSMSAYKKLYDPVDHTTYNMNDDECAQHYDQHVQHDIHYGPNDAYDENHYDHQYGDDQFEHQQAHYYYDENGYEVHESFEHPSEYDEQPYDNHQGGYESQNNFYQKDDDSLESYDATQQYRYN